MKGPLLTPGRQVALLAASACVLFAAVATAGTRDDPYAPNEWAFTHTYLADLAVRTGEIPVNWAVFWENSLSETYGDFRAATGLERLSFYATTAWHFWNGMPLHPSLVATLALLTGLPAETVVRAPVGGVLAVLLVYASASLLLSRVEGVDARVSAATPFLVALASAPLALDLRVLMPSVTLVAVLLFLHLMLRRLLEEDKRALPLALAPLALLPFWYYTMAYFFILLFAGFVLVAWIHRYVHGATAPAPLVPPRVAVVVPGFLVAILALNGVLASQLHMVSLFNAQPRLTQGLPADYESFLNRETWRSALLYAELTLLFAPMGLLALVGVQRVARRRPMGPARTLFTAWALGGFLFSALMLGTVGLSFLNRSAIYLAPVGILAFTYFFARHWRRREARVAFAATVALMTVATPTLLATATPAYAEGDRAAFEWMAGHLPREAAIYSSLEASSVLFRQYGFLNVTASQPTRPLLESFWYSDNPSNVAPYLSTSDYLVLRDDFRAAGFEEFGPARLPISEAAYGKFHRSRDLHLMFDNGEVQVFRVDLQLSRVRPSP